MRRLPAIISVAALALALGLSGCKQAASIVKIIATPTQPGEATRTPTPTLMVIPPTASLTLAASAAGEPTPWRMTVVARAAANVRSAPNEEAAVIGLLPPGTQVDVLEFSKDWYKVQAKGLDLPGWMHQSVLAGIITADLARTPNAGARTPTPAAFPRQMVITAKITANVRATPADDGKLLAQLPRGATVQALAVSGEWYRISAADLEGEGWVHGSVLAERLAAELPVSTPTAAPPSPTAPTVSATPAAPVAGTPWPMVITAWGEANVRAKPADDGEVLARLPRGTAVQALAISGEWYQIRAEAFQGEGWVHKSVLSDSPVADAPTAPPPTAVVPPGTGTPWLMYVSAQEEANVRAAPADEGEILGILPRGTRVTVLEASGEWLKVRADALEREGWVHSSVLSATPVE